MVSARLIIMSSAVFLCSCDVNLFGWKAVGGGYYLDDWREGIPAYILFPPDGGSVESPTIRVEQLGWKEPLILAQPEETRDQWVVIDTRTHQRKTISEAERTTDPAYRDIAVYHAADAWERLRRRKQW